MRCTMCESKKKLKPEIKNLKYDISGLDNVMIYGVKEYHCDHCGERYLQYGNHDEIDSAIAEALLKKEKSLTGKEIRFLRTWKGYSGQRFANLLNTSAAHLYRIEAKDSSVEKAHKTGAKAGKTLAEVAMAFYRQLFAVEDELREQPPDERCKARLEMDSGFIYSGANSEGILLVLQWGLCFLKFQNLLDYTG